MTYQEYLTLARNCKTADEAEALIELVANDWTITARQYQNIRYTAIKAGHQM